MTAIGTAVWESRSPGFSHHSSNWREVSDTLCQNARDDNFGLTEIVKMPLGEVDIANGTSAATSRCGVTVKRNGFVGIAVAGLHDV